MPGRYLLDTHVFLEIANPVGPPTGALARVLNDPAARIYLSVVTVIEACIKAALGKLPLPRAIEADPAAGFRAACDEAGFTLVPIDAEHAAVLRTLPMHHKDPFDRLLIAQAMHEGLILVSRDHILTAYDGLTTMRP